MSGYKVMTHENARKAMAKPGVEYARPDNRPTVAAIRAEYNELGTMALIAEGAARVWMQRYFEAVGTLLAEIDQ